MSEARFEGFPAQGRHFLRELARRQDRDWFTEHKGEFELCWQAPMRSLLGEAATRLATAYPDDSLDSPRMHRIQRDLRFSRDRTPYHTWVGGLVPLSGEVAALYVRLGLDEEFGGAGLYAMDAPSLARYREAVLDDQTGSELLRLVARLERGEHALVEADALKSTPRGVDPAHPRARLLRQKGLAVRFPRIPVSVRRGRALLGWLVANARKVAPLVRWLQRNVAG